MDRVERHKLFTRAWEEIGVQIDGDDPWRSSIREQLVQAEKREQQILARLEAQEAMLRRILDRQGPARDAAPAGALADATPARQTVQISFPRTLAPSARIRTDL